MCYFVVAALPKDVDIESAAEVFAIHGKRLAKASIAIAGPSVPTNVVLYFTGRGPCDCDTLIGSRSPRRMQRGPNKRDLRKLRKKGWSQAKIERWLAAKNSDVVRKEHELIQSEDGTVIGLEEWQALIQQVLSLSNCHRLGIMLLWAPDAQNHLSHRTTIPVSELTADLLRDIEESVFYEFTTNNR